MKRVLQSLEMATLGSSGLPQDTRLLFKALRDSAVHKVDGLVIENANTYTRHIRTTPYPRESHRRFLDQSNYLLAISGIEPHRRKSLAERRLPRFHRLYETFLRSNRFETASFEMRLFRDVLWRLLFQRSLKASDRAILDRGDVRFTNLTNSDVWRALGRSWRTPRLDTKGYDTAIFPDARAIQVDAGTTKIIRYHDTIPVTDPDLLGDGQYSAVHFQSLEACKHDSYFVCNSTATRTALLNLHPEVEPFSYVIPCTIDTDVSDAVWNLRVSDILRARVSASSYAAYRKNSIAELAAQVYEQAGKELGIEDDLSSLGAEISEDEAALRKARSERVSSYLKRAEMTIDERPFRYILMVAALEPKKNIPTAIRAWERVRARGDKVKFILVGGSGWASERSLEAMNPHIDAGTMLHVQNLPFIELQALMLHAEMILFPSYSEGFGYPPMEAMCVGTPAVVSDIPAHRDILEDMATFANPYDPQDLADKIEMVLAARRGAPKGQPTGQMAAHVAKFSVDVAAQKWNGLISRLEPRRSAEG